MNNHSNNQQINLSKVSKWKKKTKKKGGGGHINHKEKRTDSPLICAGLCFQVILLILEAFFFSLRMISSRWSVYDLCRCPTKSISLRYQIMMLIISENTDSIRSDVSVFKHIDNRSKFILLLIFCILMCR